MGNRPLRLRLLGPGPAIALSAIFLITSFLITPAAKNTELFGNYYLALILLNVVGVVVLALLTALNVWRLIREFRAGVLGSRLTLKFVGSFSILTLAPLIIVYFFAVNFLSRGIDSWFDVQIEQALDDALLLGRSSLETIKYDVLEDVRNAASRVARVGSGLGLAGLMDELRENGGFTQISLHANTGRILPPWSSGQTDSLVPDAPDESVLVTIRRGLDYAKIEPVSGGGLRLRVAVSVPESSPLRVLQVLYPLPLRHSRLGESIQSATAEFERLQYLRNPLKFNFVITLSMIALMTTLIALWIGIYLSRRMVSPLADLAEGTRAVAQGNYQTKLPVTSSDELGILVQSFNDMTRQVNNAQNALSQSRQAAEEQHAYLDTVLTHLSSGVISFDSNGALRTHNSGASRILDADFGQVQGMRIDDLIATLPANEPFFSAIKKRINASEPAWREQIVLQGRQGRQTLICSGTRLPEQITEGAGYVIVFDDASELIKAQRDAAWGDVARRLAHEIKNPLTPIQLSAERIRHKFLDQVKREEKENLDRATRTIIEQVESMKSLVNAFSEYAQPVQLEPNPVDLHQLIRDVVELHGQQPNQPKYSYHFEDDLPPVLADSAGLRQILNNLILNARDALAGIPNAETRIQTRSTTIKERQYVVLEFSDNGPGFPESLLAQIFDPYVTTKDKGTGLGLAINRRIVNELGGEIRAENRIEGGAAVIIQLLATVGAGEASPRSK
jgi:nitrogen fixation/metabolism regulation signal transduction histidine kinase